MEDIIQYIRISSPSPIIARQAVIPVADIGFEESIGN